MRTGIFKNEWLWVAGILLVTFLVFSPALKNDFVSWDDGENISLNENVKELNAASLKGMFSSTITGGYTPLTSLSFAVEIHFFGIKPVVFHLNNILLHLLCTLLVFIFLRKLGLNLFISLVATFLFGIQPMRVESVAWISERKDVLYGFFYLLALISYITWYSSRRLVFYFLALLAFVFALLAKIQAVSLPLILWLVHYYLDGRFRFKQVIDKIPFFLLSLATGIVGILVLTHDGELDTGAGIPIFQRLFIASYSLCAYLIKALIPYQMSAIYPYPDGLSVLHYISLPVILFLAFLIYKSKEHRRELIFGSLFFLFNVLFVLQIVGAGQALMADRFTYLAYIGLFFLIARAIYDLYTGKWKTYVIVLGVLYLAVAGTITWNRTQVWKNTETLFTDVLKKYPKVATAYNNLGFYYRDQNQNTKAIEAYGKAIELNPEGQVSYMNRGEVWFGRGEVDKALADMDRAILLKPDYVKALVNRGAIFGSKAQYKLAIDDLDKAITLDVKNLPAYSNRILLYYSMGDYNQASQEATTYLSLSTTQPDIYNIRGLCFGRMNRNQEALMDFTKAIELNPKAGAYFQNRSSLLYRIGDFKGALQDVLRAGELGAKVDPEYVKMLKSRQDAG